jgi:hypothetical protein
MAIKRRRTLGRVPSGNMERKIILKKLLLLFIVVFVITGKVSWSGDDESYILRLHYHTSYDIKIYQNKPDLKTLEYKVHLRFPSKDVVNFYDDKLKEIGFVPFVDPGLSRGDRTWKKFTDGTIKGDPLVHQLHAHWTNKDHSKMLVLVIKYYSTNMTWEEKMRAKEPNNNIQEVFLHIMPYIILQSPEVGKLE